jgi:polysaccharide biosynthesis transport protein
MASEARTDSKDGQGTAAGAAAANASERELDVRHYLRIVKKRKWLILGVLAAVTALFVLWTARQPRVYQAVATVVIDPQAPKLLPNQQDVVELGAGNYWDNREYYNTQSKILQSHWLASEVVRKFPALVKRVVPEPKPGASEEDVADVAASYIQAGLRVLPVRESRIFGIGFRDRDPKLAAEVANDIASVFIEQNRAVKIDATHEANRFLARQLDTARKELSAAETALYEYRRDNNILSIHLEERQNIISKSLDEFSHAQTDTQRRRIELSSRRRAVSQLITSDESDAPSSYVAQSETIGPLRTVWLQERAKLRVLTDKYGEKWPEVAAQEARVKQAIEDLRAEGQRLIKSIDAEIKALADAEASYTAQLGKLTEEALDLSQKEIAYKRLSRDAANAEQVYGALLKRLNESGIQERDVTNNIRPLDEAVAPTTAVEPRLRQATVFGLGAGLLLALALAFLMEMLDRSIKTQEDIETFVGLPFLGLVPIVEPEIGKRAIELYVAAFPNSSAAECCRVVRTNILFCSPDRPLRSLAVTSSNPLEGKTMTVVNLGIVMSQSGHRTLLVDSDMRRPRLHKIFGVSSEHGLSRAVLDQSDLDNAVRSTGVPNLFVMPCGPMPPNPAELLQTEKFHSLVRKLGDRFDRVIFDSPPVLAVTDAAILSRLVDGTALVIRSGRTTRDAVIRSRGQLAAVNAHLIGVILNHVDLNSPHYSSYYGYQNHYYTADPVAASAAPEKVAREG